MLVQVDGRVLLGGQWKLSLDYLGQLRGLSKGHRVHGDGPLWDDILGDDHKLEEGVIGICWPMCTYNYNIAVHSVTMMSLFFLKNG